MMCGSKGNRCREWPTTRGGRSVCVIHDNVCAMFQLLNMVLTGVQMPVMQFTHQGARNSRHH
jgi:hypothetical protein